MDGIFVSECVLLINYYTTARQLDMTEPIIYRYSHCVKDAVQCCENAVPDVCDICKQEIKSFLVPPYEITSPLATAKPYSVVIKSPNGTGIDGFVCICILMELYISRLQFYLKHKSIFYLFSLFLESNYII